MKNKSLVNKFKDAVWNHHKESRRDLPWRKTRDPYKILVSEIMLQQTQVSRVLIKYKSFLDKFPTLQSLATAPLREVLLEWQGLGYNRRGLYLKKTAEVIVKDYKGKFPKSYDELVNLPGIGQSTAGALLNFSFNTPTVFIETNIRSVFLHFFFKNESFVPDTIIRELVNKTLDHSNSREWYYALYDYGTMLKSSKDKSVRTVHRKSKHYKKQSSFTGSNREIRSNILKGLLSTKKTLTTVEIAEKLGLKREIIEKNLVSMENEGLVMKKPKGWKTA